jgi:3-oxoacyl-[acyl-carrier protein] reductase
MLSKIQGSNHVAVVTGASRGLGRAIAVRFGTAGYRVAVNYRARTPEALETVRRIEGAGAFAMVCQADVRDAKAVASMIATVAETWGRLDVLVCNAAMTHDDLLVRVSEESWHGVVETILSGTFHCLQSAGSVMVQQGGGCVIMLGSLSGLQGGSGQGPYAAAKAGLIGLMKTAAREWGPDQIRVNMVLPGGHPTDLTGHREASTPPPFAPVLGHGTTIDAVGDFVLDLAAMPNISGQIFSLDSRVLPR